MNLFCTTEKKSREFRINPFSGEVPHFIKTISFHQTKPFESIKQNRTKGKMEKQSNIDPPKKKQRMSVVCLNCKTRKIKCDRLRPACSNCIKCNVENLCQYEAPHWLGRVTATKRESLSDGNEVHGISLSSASSASSVVDPQAEIDRLKAIIRDLRHAQPSNANPYTSDDTENNDIVDFYALYDALMIKRSGMIENKPLSSIALETNDQYYMIMLGYGNLCNTYYRSQHGDIERKPGNKKERLDGSLIQYLRLLGEFQLPEIQEIMDNFIKQRIPKKSSESSTFPNLNLEPASSTDDIKSRIQMALPTRRVIKTCLNRFYKYIYPFFPYISQTAFDERMFNNILAYSNDDSPITIIIEDKYDFGLLSVLLIIMRLTYVSLPKTSNDPEVIFLKKFPIGPEFVSLALNALSLFKMLRKVKLTIVQALLYLKVYLSHSPEDSDGTALGQSQVLSGLIIQSALTIGLNRDPNYHQQVTQDRTIKNTWRRTWFGILEFDRATTTLSGYCPSIQDRQSYNVEFPELTSSDFPIEHEMLNELKRSQQLLNSYSSLLKLVNNVATGARVTDIDTTLRRMIAYTNINFSLEGLESLDKLDEETRIKVSFRNTKKLYYQLHTKSLSLTTYQNLSLYYEAKNENTDLSKLKLYRELMAKTTTELTNIIYKYLNDQYSEFIDSNHLFTLNILIQNAYQRTFNSYVSLLSRLYHTSDLISRGVTTKNITFIKLIENFTSILFTIAAGLNSLILDKMGRVHYQIFKQCYKHKFILRSMKQDQFKCIRDTLDFLSERYSGDPGARIRLLRVVHLKTDPEHTLNVLDNLNVFIYLSEADIEIDKNRYIQSHILNDPQLNKENLIWENSFGAKVPPLSDGYQNVVNGINANNPESANIGIGGANGLVNELQQDSLYSSMINLDQLLNDDMFNFDSFNAGINDTLNWLI